jgi:hypothetical protein
MQNKNEKNQGRKRKRRRRRKKKKNSVWCGFESIKIRKMNEYKNEVYMCREVKTIIKRNASFVLTKTKTSIAFSVLYIFFVHT